MTQTVLFIAPTEYRPAVDTEDASPVLDSIRAADIRYLSEKEGN